MLRFEMDFARIAALQNGLIGLGLREGLVQASEIKAFRVTLEALAARFNHRGVLRDGRIATVRDALSSTDGPARPSRGIALLQGLDFDSLVWLPAAIQRGIRAPSTADPHSYAFRLDGRAMRRSFGVMSALGVYFDPFAAIRILWIGRSTRFADAVAALWHETHGLNDWQSVDPVYDDWLALHGA